MSSMTFFSSLLVIVLMLAFSSVSYEIAQGMTLGLVIVMFVSFFTSEKDEDNTKKMNSLGDGGVISLRASKTSNE